MNHVPIPKEKWEIYSTIYTTPVVCPRCGLEMYVHVTEHGDVYKKYSPDVKDEYTATRICDRCGEQFTIEMTGSKNLEVEKNIWYKVTPKTDRYTNAVAVILSSRKDSVIGSVTIYRDDNWNETIIHCASLDICLDTISECFYVEDVYERQDISIKEGPKPLTLSKIQEGKVYGVQVKDERSIHADYHYAEIIPYNPVLHGDDNFTETWYHIVIYKEGHREPGCIIKCGALESCIKYLYNNFFVFEEKTF